ncbi:MAG: hypothetical protein ABSC01_06420 [Verrucomicrobiota bacterium]
MNAALPKRTKTIPAATPRQPTFLVPVIKLRQPDGSLLVKAGRPEIVNDEVGVSEFHKETGISKRHIATLCEQGLIQHRRLTPKKDSKILIPRSEISRFRNLDDEASEQSPKMPTAALSATLPCLAGRKSLLPHRGVRRLESGARSNPQKSTRKS